MFSRSKAKNESQNPNFEINELTDLDQKKYFHHIMIIRLISKQMKNKVLLSLSRSQIRNFSINLHIFQIRLTMPIFILYVT